MGPAVPRSARQTSSRTRVQLRPHCDSSSLPPATTSAKRGAVLVRHPAALAVKLTACTSQRAWSGQAAVVAEDPGQSAPQVIGDVASHAARHASMSSRRAHRPARSPRCRVSEVSAGHRPAPPAKNVTALPTRTRTRTAHPRYDLAFPHRQREPPAQFAPSQSLIAASSPGSADRNSRIGGTPAASSPRDAQRSRRVRRWTGSIRHRGLLSICVSDSETRTGDVAFHIKRKCGLQRVPQQASNRHSPHPSSSL